MTTAAEPRSDGGERATRIAGTVIQFLRRKQGFRQEELAGSIGIDQAAMSLAEGGKARFRFYREYIGKIASELDLGSRDIVLVLDAAWVDEVLADIVALSRRPAADRWRCLVLLQYLWFQPNTRAWLNVLLGANPSFGSVEPSIGRHPAFHRRDPRPKRRLLAPLKRSRIGQHGTPEESLKRPLFVDKERGAATLANAVRAAQREAIATLQQRSETDVPKVGELLLLFGGLAADDRRRAELVNSLRALKPESLSTVDRHYRARVLYELGDGAALCADVSSGAVGLSASRALLDRYADVGRDGELAAVSALHELSSHIGIALERKSAPLLALHWKTAYDVVTSCTRNGRPVVANLATTRRLRVMTALTLRAFSKIRRSAEGGAESRWSNHDCAHDPTCSERAKHYAEVIATLVEDVSNRSVAHLR